MKRGNQRRETMRNQDPNLRACMYYRDGDGYCRLVNRCWSGKPCPTSQAEADKVREQLCDEYIANRSAA